MKIIKNLNEMKNRINIKKFIILGISLSSLLSCNNILDLEPITDPYIDPANPLGTAEKAEKAMAAVNATFGIENWQFDYFYLGDAGSDVAYSGGDGDEFFQIDQYRIQSTNYVIERDWNHFVNHIKSCNIVINYADLVPDLSQNRKDEMVGEASLIRALNRFQAVQTWGEYPIVNEVVLSISGDSFESVEPYLFPSRKPIAEVYASIIADCEVALARAPISTSAPENKYRATKGAAHALLAKVYATKPNPDWDKVIEECNVVINGGYSLLTTYDHLFDGNHEGNAESIWEINGQGSGSVLNMWGPQVFLGNNWKKFNTPSHKLDSALDPIRKLSTIKKMPTTFADPYYVTYNNFPNPWKMRKVDGTQNFYIFRLADILLIKAEALAHTGDLTGAIALVNQTRSRVNLPNIAAATSENDAINKILQERFVELAHEGQRWFDLKREGKAIEILSQQTYPKWNPETESFVTTPMPGAQEISVNDLVWPIPQKIKDNNSNLTQNPGY